MHFVIKIYRGRDATASKEDDFALLRDVRAPSAPARGAHFRTMGQIALMAYLYDKPHVERLDDHLNVDEEELSLRLGSYVIDENTGKITGDYIWLKINAAGDGFVRRPKMSFFQLFYRQTATCLTLATEIGLILLSEPRLSRRPFAQLFNYGFIYESIMREWTPRVQLDRTFAADVDRLLPHWTVHFRNHRLWIRRDSYGVADQNLCRLYLDNKAEFYGRVLDEVEQYSSKLLAPLRGQKIFVNLTGGLDSRNNLAILLWHRRNLGFSIHLQVSGPSNHPDVEVAKMVAAAVSSEIAHHEPDEQTLNTMYPHSVYDYQACFRVNQGDVNSNVFSREVALSDAPTAFGSDNYKRPGLQAAAGLNRFFARSRVLRAQYLLLSLDVVNEAACIIGKHCDDPPGVEFSYYLLRRFAPELLDVPFAGQSLPLHFVAPWKTVEESKAMPAIERPGYTDLKLINENLKSIIPASLLEKVLKRCFGKAARRWEWIMNSHRVAPKYFRKLSLDSLNTNRKKRIAMDYAAVANLTPEMLFKGSAGEHNHLRP